MTWLRSIIEAICYVAAPNLTIAAGMLIAWDDLVQRVTSHPYWPRLGVERTETA